MSKCRGRLDLKTVTHTEIMHAFRFDFKKGKVYWKNHKFRKDLLGMEAGGITKPTTPGNKPYWDINFNGWRVKRSRLIYYAFHSRPPEKILDHRNGDSLDDRPHNLREVSHAQNVWNVKTIKKQRDLPVGVNRKKKRFTAHISHNNKPIYLGLFKTPEEASSAYQKKRQEIRGNFS